MKAAVYDVAGAPGVLKYVDIPDPITGPDDILIAVEAISIEGGDLINRRSTPPPLPSWVVGYAAAGTVVAVGSNVRSRKVGDRVAAFHLQGSHAERWAVPAEHTWLIPDGVEMPGSGGGTDFFCNRASLSFHPRHAPTRRNRPYSGRGGWRGARGRSACLTSRRNGHRRGKRNAAQESVA
ncbi:zinc-binding alcohol dehydrogenase family protein [Klebsiella variicola subsp. variicola]|nr:zinc-binding alcohol dehydrogenase family protein [Klebsiella variicola subsp. variicola]